MLSVLSGKVVVMITDRSDSIASMGIIHMTHVIDTYATHILLYIAAPLEPEVYRLDEWFRRSGIFVKIL